MSNTMSGKVSVWATSDYQLAEVLRYISDAPKEYDSIVPHTFATLDPESEGISGWTKVGMADLAITFDSADSIQGHTVASLKREIANVQAEAQNKITQLTKKLNEVLALTMENSDD